MRLLLSADDLIALYERSEPITPEQFKAWLQSRDGCLVLTGTSVVETSVALLEAGKASELRGLVQTVTAVPVCYLKEIAIFVEELGGALIAFGRGKEPLTVDPYVAKWSDTLGISLGKSYVSQGIAEIVTHLWRTAPEALRHFHRYQEILAEELASEPSALAANAAPRDFALQQFERYTERQLKLHGFALPQAGISVFASWVYSNPLRCPGLRLAFELNQEVVKHANKEPAETGLRGLGHIHAIPYVDGITLQRPLFEHCQSVSRSLQRVDPTMDYGDRTFANLRSVLDQWP
ncbi:MAG: hypothetical protein HYX73_02760 [Acidobacteria bacterium]|nr:hypothetical protein [Acidobacteriota bacterium]